MSRDVRPGSRIVRSGHLLLRLLVIGLGAAVGFAVLSLPQGGSGLAEASLEQLSRSGVTNPVTAVLMNYRGYDTLLEITVLFMALLGVWSSATLRHELMSPPSLVLRFLNQLLVPFLILFAGYLLWAGSEAPGGAFQAGAVVAAAGVLIVLSHDVPGAPIPDGAYRLLMVLGLGAFCAAGAATAAAGAGFLVLPPPYAKAGILAIESAASVSIGLTLIAIFRGGRPAGHGRESSA